MTTFTDDQARQQLETILRLAQTEGEARIRTRDGAEFTIRPVKKGDSPFDISGVDLHLSGEEIVTFVRESREKQGG